MYKVLIVEPQEFALKALLNLPVWGKGPDGFVCTDTATNGEEALTLLKTKKYDLVLTEINLSIYDGLQLLKLIHRENEEPLFVFVSDIVSFSYARESFIYGAFDYLPKPVSKENMQALFERAAERLKRQKRLQASASTLSTEFNSLLTKGQIAKLLSKFSRKDETVLEMFRKVMISLCKSSVLAQSHDILLSRLFAVIVEAIFSKHEWLFLYISQNFHKRLDYLVLHDTNNYVDYYQRKFTGLFQLYCQLNPDFKDETLKKIHLYILQHPEEDLKLTSIAKKFYINHSYLSNLFSKKSSIRYSKLITLVKLKRAEYLLTYTDLPIIDIAYKLGYKDVNYFNQIFKKVIGKSPSDYDREENSFYDYII